VVPPIARRSLGCALSEVAIMRALSIGSNLTVMPMMRSWGAMWRSAQESERGFRLLGRIRDA